MSGDMIPQIFPVMQMTPAPVNTRELSQNTMRISLVFGNHLDVHLSYSYTYLTNTTCGKDFMEWRTSTPAHLP